jgi:hypothetical protein
MNLSITRSVHRHAIDFPNPWTPEVLFQLKFDQQIRVVAKKGGMVFTLLNVVLEESGGPNHIDP